MFLAMLNDDQQRAFSTLAFRMVAADGSISAEERRAIRRLRAELRVEEAGTDDRDESALATVFDTRRAKYAALLELLGLAHSDREFHLDEQSMVTAVAHEMDVSADELARLDRWVQDYVRHVESALAMMAE